MAKSKSKNGDGTSTLEMGFPIKGINRTAGWHDQPSGTTPDCLNVMPYDVYGGRARGGQRPGFATFTTPDFGSGVPVRGMIQTTRALDPDTIVADQVLLDEKFSDYEDGTLVADIGGGTRWTCTPTDDRSPIITAGVARLNSSSPGGWAAYARFAFPLGSVYLFKATGVVTSDAFAGRGLSIALKVGEVPITGSGDQRIIVTLKRTNVYLNYHDGTTSGEVSAGGGSVNLDDSEHTLSVQVNGDKIIVLVDGAQKLSWTNPHPERYTKEAFYVGNWDSLNAGYVSRFQVFTGKSPLSFRQTDITAVAGDGVYVGQWDQATDWTKAGTLSSATDAVSLAGTSDTVYLVNGTDTKAVDLETQTMADLAASAGTLPDKCRIAALWRNRLILAAPDSDPQNFYASRVGVHTDFDYTQTDPATAFAGNASKAGQIGQPITAIMPFTADLMLIGCDHSLWQVTGDPADGGSIDLVSASVGVAGQGAWCQDPGGVIYFVGDNGLYRMAPGGVPEYMAGKAYPQFFEAIDTGNQYVNCLWDKYYRGLWIFVTPAQETEATHLFWDSRTGGFFPMQFANARGPLSAMVYDGDSPGDRALVLGGRDGQVMRSYPGLTATDAAAAIKSHVVLGPFRPAGGTNQARLISSEWYLGEKIDDDDAPSEWDANDQYHLDYSIQAADTPQQAVNDPAATASGSFTGNLRQTIVRSRLRGAAYAVKLSNQTLDHYWSFERVNLTFEPAGRIRT